MHAVFWSVSHVLNKTGLVPMHKLFTFYLYAQNPYRCFSCKNAHFGYWEIEKVEWEQLEILEIRNPSR
jgi:hypothetical protein